MARTEGEVDNIFCRLHGGCGGVVQTRIEIYMGQNKARPNICIFLNANAASETMGLLDLPINGSGEEDWRQLSGVKVKIDTPSAELKLNPDGKLPSNYVMSGIVGLIVYKKLVGARFVAGSGPVLLKATCEEPIRGSELSAADIKFLETWLRDPGHVIGESTRTNSQGAANGVDDMETFHCRLPVSGGTTLDVRVEMLDGRGASGQPEIRVLREVALESKPAQPQVTKTASTSVTSSPASWLIRFVRGIRDKI